MLGRPNHGIQRVHVVQTFSACHSLISIYSVCVCFILISPCFQYMIISFHIRTSFLSWHLCVSVMSPFAVHYHQVFHMRSDRTFRALASRNEASVIRPGAKFQFHLFHPAPRKLKINLSAKSLHSRPAPPPPP